MFLLGTAVARVHIALFLLATGTSCADPQPTPPARNGPSPLPLQEPTTTFDPPRASDDVASVTRIRVRWTSRPAPRIHLFTGELSASEKPQAKRETLPAALRAREIECLAWIDPSDAERIAIAPLTQLAQGSTYSLVLPDVLATFQVRREPEPFLRRIFPPKGEALLPTSQLVLCGAHPLPALDRDLALEPDAPLGRVRSLVLPPLSLPECLSFRSREGTSEGPFVLPAMLPLEASAQGDAATGASTVLLDPAALALAPSSSPTPTSPLFCTGHEVAVGLGCGDMQDDRIVLRAGKRPLLWNIGANSAHWMVAAPGEGTAIMRLGQLLAGDHLDVVTLDTSGAAHVSESTWAPRVVPHVRLTEVYANPLGKEPDQEWVEIFNDGPRALDLATLSLLDDAGPQPLPGGSLAAGGYALIVGPRFQQEDGVDPSVPRGANVLQVARLGLSNQGEALRLVDASGATLAHVPAVALPPGTSLCLSDIDLADDAAHAFRVCAASEVTPGAGRRGEERF